MNKLKHMLRLSQDSLKKELELYLKSLNMETISEDGFLYAKGDVPILFVAHLDTVAENPPKKLNYNSKIDILYSPDGILGGDDRCGVYAIWFLLKKYRPHVLFTEDEEIGCIGAKKAVKSLSKPNVKYIVELDRRGKNDCVFYGCSNEEFIDYIRSYDFGVKFGTNSDISVLGPAWDIATVNLSVGYYNEHTSCEYIKLYQLFSTIEKSEFMIKDINNTKYFNYDGQLQNSKNSVRVRG